MDVREKLVELLKSAYGTSFNAPHLSEHQLEPLASHLIAHGVTVQGEASWKLNRDGSGTCSYCNRTQKSVWDYDNFQAFCGSCGSKMSLPQPPKGE